MARVVREDFDDVDPQQLLGDGFLEGTDYTILPASDPLTFKLTESTVVITGGSLRTDIRRSGPTVSENITEYASLIRPPTGSKMESGHRYVMTTTFRPVNYTITGAGAGNRSAWSSALGFMSTSTAGSGDPPGAYFSVKRNGSAPGVDFMRLDGVVRDKYGNGLLALGAYGPSSLEVANTITATFIIDTGSGGCQLYATTTAGTTFTPYPSTATLADGDWRYFNVGGFGARDRTEPYEMEMTWDFLEVVNPEVGVVIGSTNLDDVISSFKIIEEVDAAGRFDAVITGTTSTLLGTLKNAVTTSTNITITQGTSGTVVWRGFAETLSVDALSRESRIGGRDWFAALMKTSVAEISEFNSGGRDSGTAPVATDAGPQNWNTLASTLVSLAGLNHFHQRVGYDFIQYQADAFTTGQTAASTTAATYSHEYGTVFQALMGAYDDIGMGWGPDFKHFWWTASTLHFGYPRDPDISANTAIDRWTENITYSLDTTETYRSSAWFYRTSGSAASSSTFGDWGSGGSPHTEGYYAIWGPDNGASHRAASSSSFADYVTMDIRVDGQPTIAEAALLQTQLGKIGEEYQVQANSLLLGDVHPYSTLVLSNKFLGLNQELPPEAFYVRKLVHTKSDRERSTRIWFDTASGVTPIAVKGSHTQGLIEVETSTTPIYRGRKGGAPPP